LKKIISTLAIAMLIAGTIFTGCQSSAGKEEAAQAKVKDAKQDLKEVQNEANADAQKAATAEEWKAFKSESEAKIKDHEIRIAELKAKMKKPGKTFDALYEKRIDALEQKNRDLKIRMEAYEKSQSDWESFKREFNHDMDELVQALKDITVDNKK
jgi:hypothetical protein